MDSPTKDTVATIFHNGKYVTVTVQPISDLISRDWDWPGKNRNSEIEITSSPRLIPTESRYIPPYRRTKKTAS